jgi:hypothetical protein
MNSSLVRRWRSADAIILAAVYGKRANTVLSRPARKPVAYANATRPRQAGFPFPAGVPLRLRLVPSCLGFGQSPRLHATSSSESAWQSRRVSSCVSARLFPSSDL